jgi:hypothetical protein
VRTFLQSVAVILTFRDRANGLLLSELGGYLLSPDLAPAGTKRLSNVLHSVKWSVALIRDYLWQRAREQWTRLPASPTARLGDLGREQLGEARKHALGRTGTDTLQ